MIMYNRHSEINVNLASWVMFIMMAVKKWHLAVKESRRRGRVLATKSSVRAYVYTSTKSLPACVTKLLLPCADKKIFWAGLFHSQTMIDRTYMWKRDSIILHFFVYVYMYLYVVSIELVLWNSFPACCYIICAAIIISNMLPYIILWTCYFFDEMDVSVIGLATMFLLFI